MESVSLSDCASAVNAVTLNLFDNLKAVQSIYEFPISVIFR